MDEGTYNVSSKTKLPYMFSVNLSLGKELVRKRRIAFIWIDNNLFLQSYLLFPGTCIIPSQVSAQKAR